MRLRLITKEYYLISSKKGQGVVVEGNFKNNSFNADNVLAKHDENYMPPELKNLNLNNDNLK